MAHLCVPQNQALRVCRGSVPGVQVCGTLGREDLVNATITSNAEKEEYTFYLVYSIFMGEKPTYMISLKKKTLECWLVFRYLQTDFFQTQYDDKEH